ncbi:MAG TPA: hypothetical protein VIH52_03945 [Candidatus Nanoarchaeia archaeon]|nr:hypothetical protein [uncultured archaeon]
MLKRWNDLSTDKKLWVLFITVVLISPFLAYLIIWAVEGPPGPARNDHTNLAIDVWVPNGAEIKLEKDLHIGEAASFEDVGGLDNFKALGLPKVTVVRNSDDTQLTYWAKNPDSGSVTDLYRVVVPVYSVPVGSSYTLLEHRLDPVNQKVYATINHYIDPRFDRYVVSALVMTVAVTCGLFVGLYRGWKILEATTAQPA